MLQCRACIVSLNSLVKKKRYNLHLRFDHYAFEALVLRCHASNIRPNTSFFSRGGDFLHQQSGHFAFEGHVLRYLALQI